MRVVVFSDSHNNYSVLKNIVLKHKDVETFIHLGDGEGDVKQLITAFPDRFFLQVKGNCDWDSDIPVESVVAVEGKNIFFTHGHHYYVKSSLDKLMASARKKDAAIALFGHTHHGVATYDNGLYLMNPGSVSYPRDGQQPSYGIVDIGSHGIVLNVVRV